MNISNTENTKSFWALVVKLCIVRIHKKIPRLAIRAVQYNFQVFKWRASPQINYAQVSVFFHMKNNSAIEFCSVFILELKSVEQSLPQFYNYVVGTFISWEVEMYKCLTWVPVLSTEQEVYYKYDLNALTQTVPKSSNTVILLSSSGSSGVS